jgi:hypothetical protein
MKSTLALIAMAAAATANASVSDAVLANAMAFAKDARKVIDANNGRRQLAEEEATYMKGKCVKGQATDIASMKASGIDLVIPTTGYCMESDGTSSLLTCDGTIYVGFFNPPQIHFFPDRFFLFFPFSPFPPPCTGTTLNYQRDDKPGCKQVTKNTTKLDMSANLGPCVVGEVEGVHVDMYKKADCSDAPKTLIVAKDSCMNGVLKVGCDADKVTLSGYPADSKCAGDADATVTFTSGDDKCHDSSALSSASSVALTAGIAFVGLIASLALM